MLKLLGIKKYRKVFPLDNNIQSSNLSDHKMLYSNNDPSTVFIMIEGMGTTSQDTCRVIENKNSKTMYMFNNVNYDSKNIVFDTFRAVGDLNEISTSGSLNNYGKLGRSDRLNKLTKIIKDRLNSHFNRVIVVGTSHGSLLVHGAILKIKMDPECDIHIDKLRIWTLGSPRYLPQKLLPLPDDEPRILNFYNTLDPVVRALFTGMQFLTSVQVPNLKALKDNSTGWKYCAEDDNYEIVDEPTKDRAKYIYKDGIVYLKNVEKYNENINENFKLWGAASKYHGSYYNFFPLIDFILMYVMHTNEWKNRTKELPITSYSVNTVCDSQSGGSKSKETIYLCANKKKYIVKKDKYGHYVTIKNVKVHLSEIKGKYRYVK